MDAETAAPKAFEFNLIFRLPEGTDHDLDELSGAIWDTFPEDDPLVGIGRTDQLGIMLELPGEDFDTVVQGAVKRALAVLPEGTSYLSVEGAPE